MRNLQRYVVIFTKYADHFGDSGPEIRGFYTNRRDALDEFRFLAAKHASVELLQIESLKRFDRSLGPDPTDEIK